MVPVVEALSGARSRSTRRAPWSRRALELGARMVNDVSALRRDPDLAGVVADSGAELCLMHLRGDPHTMRGRAPRYDDVHLPGPRSFSRERLAFAVAAGSRRSASASIRASRLRQDPGRNLGLVRHLDRIVAISCPVLVGLSRKSTLARVLEGNDARVGRRRVGRGGRLRLRSRRDLFRVHDVRSHVEALTVAAAVELVASHREDRAARDQAADHHGVLADEQERSRRFPRRPRPPGSRTPPPPRPTGSRTRSTIATSLPRWSGCRTPVCVQPARVVRDRCGRAPGTVRPRAGACRRAQAGRRPGAVGRPRRRRRRTALTGATAGSRRS